MAAPHPYVVLTGNPNCGKSTLFNLLTGLRAKVGNYAGVTVEKKEGRLLGTVPPQQAMVLDLPGTYSLTPQSLDEQVARDVLFQRIPEVPPPSLVVVVLDASNLQRNLYYATQVIELGYPVMVALNMTDVAAANGVEVDAGLLEEELGAPVFPVVASQDKGVAPLREAILTFLRERKLPATAAGRSAGPLGFSTPPAAYENEVNALAAGMAAEPLPGRAPNLQAFAHLLLSDARVLEEGGFSDGLRALVERSRKRLEAAGVDWQTTAIESRYAILSGIQDRVCGEALGMAETFSDRLDRILTHKYLGMLVFVLIMALMFQSIFTLAQWPMEWMEGLVGWLGGKVGGMIPPGDLRDLVVDGVFAGVGAVVVFLPQICLLFLFIGLLEDTGYMARAAFLMDRLMSKVGLHGKSFIPMLSSFACAIPGIMATRTIESPKDRLVTILVAPLMSCSARLPVYALLIAACIPDLKMLGFIKLQGLTMLAMYLLGIVVALAMAWLFKKTLLKGETPLLIMELPPYKRPVPRIVLRHMWDRSQLFLRRAGTVILGISIILWFLATYPRSAEAARAFEAKKTAIERAMPAMENPPAGYDAAREYQLGELEREFKGETLRRSFAGRVGHMVEPFIRPLGMDWKIGIGLVASFAAREVFVSTMSTVYNVAGADEAEDGAMEMAAVLKAQKNEDGSQTYTPLVGVTLMVFYVFALQCVSTVAVVRRETNSWKWPLFQWLYMGVLAWGLAFVTYQAGRLLGF